MDSGHRPFVVAFWTTLFGSVLCLVLLVVNRGTVSTLWRRDAPPPTLAIEFDEPGADSGDGFSRTVASSPSRERGPQDPFPELDPAAPEFAFPVSRDLPEWGVYGEFHDLIAPSPPVVRNEDTPPAASASRSASAEELTRLEEDVASLRREIERLAETHLSAQLQVLESKQQELLALESDGVLPHLIELMETISAQQQKLAEAEERRQSAPALLPSILPGGTADQPISLRVEVAEMAEVLDHLTALTREVASARAAEAVPVPTQSRTQTTASLPTQTEVADAPSSRGVQSQGNACLCCHRVRNHQPPVGARPVGPTISRPRIALSDEDLGLPFRQ